MKIQSNNKNRGFTIIEVMIVLAIAGLILAIIFLAVPALQRNARNTQINSDATHLGGLIETNISNNNGKTPNLITNGAAPAAPVATTVYIGSESFSKWLEPAAGASLAIGVGAPAMPPALDTFAVGSSASCDGNTPAAGSGLVIAYLLETSGGNVPHCLPI